MTQSRISEILKSLRTQKGYSQKQLAEALNVAQNTVSNWEKGIREPDLPTTTKIAEYFGVSADYLLYGFDKGRFTSLVNLVRYRRSIKEFSVDTGIDEFYLNRLCSGLVYEQPTKEIVEKIADSNQNDWLVDRETLFAAAGYGQVDGDKPTGLQNIPWVAEAPGTYTAHDDLIMIPIVGSISCGNGALAYETIEGYEPTPKEWLNGGDHFYLRAKGDSMTGARIFEGDLLLIRKQSTVDDGDIAAVLINDDNEAVLKRVYRSGDKLILQSENPKYAPILAPPGEVKIIGKLKMNIIKF